MNFWNWSAYQGGGLGARAPVTSLIFKNENLSIFLQTLIIWPPRMFLLYCAVLAWFRCPSIPLRIPKVVCLACFSYSWLDSLPLDWLSFLSRSFVGALYPASELDNLLNEMVAQVAGGFLCFICKTKVAKWASIKRHMAEVHTRSENNYQCPMCQKIYPRKSSLYFHVHKIHPELRGLDLQRCIIWILI